MKKLTLRIFLFCVAAAGVSASACSSGTADVSLTFPNAAITMKVDADANAISAGDRVPLTLSALNVVLVEPSTAPSAAHESNSGRFQVYLDTVDSSPLLITAQLDVGLDIAWTTTAVPRRVRVRPTRRGDFVAFVPRRARA